MAKHLLLVFVAAVVTIQSHALPSSASQVMRSYAESNPKVRDAIVEASAASFQETKNENEELKVSNDQLEDATGQKESVELASSSELTMASNNTATSNATSPWGRRRRRFKLPTFKIPTFKMVHSIQKATVVSQGCDGKELRVYGTDTEVAWNLKCEGTPSSTVQFVQQTQGRFGLPGYYLEPSTMSQVGAFLTGSLTSTMEVIQGNPQEEDGWRNAGGWQLKPDGHFAKRDGTDVHANEALWLLLDKTGKVIAPSWMKQAVEAPSSNSCTANTQRANANCFDYECVLMKQCLQRLVDRASSAHQSAKDACTNMQNKQANDYEKKCCLTLLAPCEQKNPHSFAHVMVNGGYVDSALLSEQDTLSEGKALAINSSADAGPEDEAGLDQSLTGKRSC